MQAGFFVAQAQKTGRKEKAYSIFIIEKKSRKKSPGGEFSFGKNSAYFFKRAKKRRSHAVFSRFLPREVSRKADYKRLLVTS
ncbi:hypothetical protein [Bittarella sp. HCP28S3_D9]|uniref:hypothetical protein n=1 Tax=Bittarella sp. HCP28S3_D9 TaxID=3440253 RepID=UPI003F8CC0AD